MNLQISATRFGSKIPKHVAESCKFIKYLTKICVNIYYII